MKWIILVALLVGCGGGTKQPRKKKGKDVVVSQEQKPCNDVEQEECKPKPCDDVEQEEPKPCPVPEEPKPEPEVCECEKEYLETKACFFIQAHELASDLSKACDDEKCEFLCQEELKVYFKCKSEVK